MIEIDFEELGYWNGHTLNDKPFTGIAYEKTDNGIILNKTSMLDGMEHGELWDYYHNGNKKSFDNMFFNRIHGYSMGWFESGVVKMESLIEYGIIVWQKKYKEKGELIYDFVIDEKHEEFNSLMNYRMNFNWTIADSKFTNKG